MNQTGLCNLPPQSGGLGLDNTRITAPGMRSSSVLLSRIQIRDANSMPPLASLKIDASGNALMQNWIAGMND
jgi:hypothetical protein